MQSSPILLANADIVVYDSTRFVRGGSIVIENGLITATGNQGALEHRPMQTIDCSGLMLIPGLVNAHTHLYQVMTRGVGKHLSVWGWVSAVTYPMAKGLDEGAYYDAVLLGCADAIRNGTTAVVDHLTQYARFHADQSMRAITASGLRGAVARGSADYSIVDAGEARPLETDLADAEAFVRRWNKDGIVQPWIGPAGFHSCTPRALTELKQLSRRLETRFHTHIGESRPGMERARSLGYAGEAAHAGALDLLDSHTSLAHVVWVSEEEISAIASSGCQVVHCPTSNQLLASGVAPVPRMVAKGVVPALATDGPSSNDSLDMVAELKSAALIHRAVSHDATITAANDVFFWATEGGARVLGHPNLGRIVPGFAADIVGIRIDGNPSLTPCEDPYAALAFYASGRDVSFVMVDGRVLYRNGEFTTLDVAKVCEKVAARARSR